MSDYAKRCDRCDYVYPPIQLRSLGVMPVNWCSSAEHFVHVRGAE